MQRCLPWLALVACFAVTSAEAADTRDTPYFLLSEGSTTCGEYIAQPELKAARLEWVLGYISGRNRESRGAERMAGTTLKMPATTVVWLEHYCPAHALDMLATAADKLRAEAWSREHH
jgi:hypothetical protein